MLARRFLTLDHLTGGRIGWNIVTAYLDSAAKDIGLPRQLSGEIAMCLRVGRMGSIKLMTDRDNITRTRARTPGVVANATSWRCTIGSATRLRTGYRCGYEVHEGWMQTGRRDVYVGSRLKRRDVREGAI
jgi:hypothetical protein